MRVVAVVDECQVFFHHWVERNLQMEISKRDLNELLQPSNEFNSTSEKLQTKTLKVATLNLE